MTNAFDKVRVRIAPSPTGDPHVGTAYVGLINYVFARQSGGSFVIRIEDTDQARSTRASEEAIFRSLGWFGLDWDEGPDKGGEFGPYRQSERTEIYKAHAETLISGGHAYRCFCTPEDLNEMRARQKELKQNFGYDRRCRDLEPSIVEKKLSEGLPYVVRLKMPRSGETIIRDRWRGEVKFQNELIDDQILLKSDGFPTYHLANVVDDHAMKISHVIRAEEWLISTPKHVVLYDAFGWAAPEFIHLPLLRNKNKSKISKRKNPVSLIYYEQAGFLPAALRNFLALMGWTHPEEKDKFTLSEMIETFSLDKVSLGSPIFDMDKLKWLNGLYIREMQRAELGQAIHETLFEPGYFEKILPLVHERMEVLEDFWRVADFFFIGEINYDPSLLIPKGRRPAETRKMLVKLMERLEASSREQWTTEIIETTSRSFCAEEEWKTKEVFMSVRLVVTGKKASPPLFETMEALGKERVRRRFQKANELLKTVK